MHWRTEGSRPHPPRGAVPRSTRDGGARQEQPPVSAGPQSLQRGAFVAGPVSRQRSSARVSSDFLTCVEVLGSRPAWVSSLLTIGSGLMAGAWVSVLLTVMG